MIFFVKKLLTLYYNLKCGFFNVLVNNDIHLFNFLCIFF